MADSGKQSPLGVNAIGSLIQDIGFWINPRAQSYMGECKTTDGDYTFGKLVDDTSLKWLTYAINDGYRRGAASQDDPSSPSGSYTLTAATYNNLISIGKDTIPALGNSPPNTWKTDDPSDVWINQHTDLYTNDQAGAPANSGYPFYSWNDPVYEGTPPTVAQRHALAYKNEGQLASWYPWSCYTSGVVPNRAITMWGWLRCFPLQAWNEYNFNGTDANASVPDYNNFCFGFTAFKGFLDYTNQAIYAIQNSKNFLQGTYSNQDDLTSADVLGVCLASRDFGQDLINLGNAMDLTLIKTFGLPSTTIQILYKNNALTQSVVAALMTADMSQADIMNIATGNITATTNQEQKIYSAMLIITGPDLAEIMLTLNCSTKTIEFLADMVNVKKMFPLSYQALTVPIYNTAPGPTNSKTYYPIYVGGEMNPTLQAPPVEKIIGTIVPPAPPTPASVEELADISLENTAINISARDDRSIQSLIGKLTSQQPSSPAPNPIPQPNQPLPSPKPVIAPVTTVTTPVTGDAGAALGGGGGGCPAPWINITLADGSTVKASDIEVGMMVYTKHENKDEWGEYKVTAKELSNDKRWLVKFTDGTQFVGTYNHRVLTDNGWNEIRNLKPGNKVLGKDGVFIVENSQYYDQGEVVKITVEDAHTYLTEGFVSHNMKFVGNDLN